MVIDIPYIKTINNKNYPANLLFRLLEVTPGMRSDTIPVFEKKVKLFRPADKKSTNLP